MTDLKYIEQVKKGSVVRYGNKHYHVQDNGRGSLHIVVFEEGKRKKISIEKLGCWWEYGSKADWIFNEWWRVYSSYEIFKSFAENEILAA